MTKVNIKKKKKRLKLISLFIYCESKALAMQCKSGLDTMAQHQLQICKIRLWLRCNNYCSLLYNSFGITRALPGRLLAMRGERNVNVCFGRQARSAANTCWHKMSKCKASCTSISAAFGYLQSGLYCCASCSFVFPASGLNDSIKYKQHVKKNSSRISHF